MTARIERICSHLPAVRVLADVGCDHGYMARHALERGLCERVYISDISRESLKKAETLLQKEIASGRCMSVCTDGLNGYPELPDCVLIAGMGGEEIVKILSNAAMPPAFVLQPMKNADKVRAFLLERGCKITADYTFEDGKFYDLIVGENGGGDTYTEWELLFGRDNLKNPTPAFLKRIRKEQGELRNILFHTTVSQANRSRLLERLYLLEEITDAVENDI